MNIKTLKSILQFNMKALGAPELVDAHNLGDNFFTCTDKKRIIDYAVRYFYAEPEKWSMPAKNYFVRICLAHYLAEKYSMSFAELMDSNDILPYDDKLAPTYSEDKETYNAILQYAPEHMEILPGYQKTIEVFGYLYEECLKPITIGYNGMGQEFFDLISFKKKYIIEYYLSLFHKMRQNPLDPDEELRTLASCNTYGIPANLLLNTPDENKNWKELITKVKKAINLHAVSVLTLDAAKAIKEEFPELKVHLSTHGAFNLKPEDYAKGYIDVLNVSEPWYLEQKDIIAAAKANGVKIKYIINRGCLINKWKNMSLLAGQEVRCNDFGEGDGTGGPLTGCEHKCLQFLKEYPWLALAYVNMSKEFLLFNKDVDIVKISTRDNPLEEVKSLLDYWTDYRPSERIIDLPIKDYGAFVQWAKTRMTTCRGYCKNCMACKSFYDKIVK